MVRGEIEVTFLRSLCIPFGVSEWYCIDTRLSTACVRVCLLPPRPWRLQGGHSECCSVYLSFTVAVSQGWQLVPFLYFILAQMPPEVHTSTGGLWKSPLITRSAEPVE